MERRTKRRTTADEANKIRDVIGSVNASTLKRILGKLDFANSMNFINKSTHELFDMCKLDLPLPLDNGAEFLWETCDVALLLATVLRRCPAYNDAFSRAYASNPPSQEKPWGLVLVYDEYIPGDKFAHWNLRKSMTIGLMFEEMGELRHHDVMWLIPAIIRTSVLKQVRGGWGTALKFFLRHLLLGPNGFMSCGAAVELGGESKLIFANLKLMMSDNDGVRLAWNWRGTASIRPCFLCQKVFKKESDLAHRVGGVEISETNPAKFLARTKADLCDDVELVNEAKRRYDAGGMTGVMYNNILKSVGMNPTEDAICLDESLMALFDPMKVQRLDWMHGMLQDGVLLVEARLLLRAAASHGVQSSEFEALLKASWKWPNYRLHKETAYRLHYIFKGSESEVDMSQLKCNASELLTLYHVIRFYVALRLDDVEEMQPHLLSFGAACEVVDTILSIKALSHHDEHTWRDLNRKLRQACQHHLEVHVDLYGDLHLKPKHHLTYHYDFSDDAFAFDI